MFNDSAPLCSKVKGSDIITGMEIFVKSYPTNFPIMLQIGMVSFSGLKNGN